MGLQAIVNQTSATCFSCTGWLAGWLYDRRELCLMSIPVSTQCNLSVRYKVTIGGQVFCMPSILDLSIDLSRSTGDKNDSFIIQLSIVFLKQLVKMQDGGELINYRVHTTD